MCLLRFIQMQISKLCFHTAKFHGAEVFSHRIHYLTIRLNDLEIGGVHVVSFN
jgi:hypothetical protein